MSGAAHILIVDDDQQIGALLTQFLGSQGFRATAVTDGQAMRRALAEDTVDLVVLDLMLPGEDGLSLLRHLRATTALPVVMLTAMGSEPDRVIGLELGADDYLAKPFSTRELLARIKAVLRRAGAAGETSRAAAEPLKVLRFAGWTLDTGRRRLRSPEGMLVELTGGEYDLLMAFLLHPQRVMNRDELMDLARGRLPGPEDRTIDVQVGHLRRKIEADPKSPELIKTVRGGGYVLAVEVRAV
ncbi:MAG: response regulator [Rhodospirillales bacterium]|nr:response regulator [Rhodospirillales bacterium]